jgi:hypothetical protein
MRYTTKNFLSPSPEESGSIICKIETQRASDVKGNQWVIQQGGHMSASVRVADCSQHVYLDFDATGQKSFEKRVMKLDKMIDDLQAMRHQYIAMWENHIRDIKWAEVQSDDVK